MEEQLPTSDKLFSCISGISKFRVHINGVKRQKVFDSLVEEANTLLDKLLDQDGTYIQDHSDEK